MRVIYNVTTANNVFQYVETVCEGIPVGEEGERIRERIVDNEMLIEKSINTGTPYCVSVYDDNVGLVNINPVNCASINIKIAR